MAKKALDMDKGTSRQSVAPDDLEGMRNLLKAANILQPTMQAAATVAEYNQDFGELNLQSLNVALRKQTSDCSKGNLEGAAAMLVAQAHTLDAIFCHLARLAINAEYVDHLDCQLKLALRAQSQCRATWETLTTIQNPPVLGYVRQANIAHGPQQVNNAAPLTEGSPSALEEPNLQSKLLEDYDAERLDPGAACSPRQVDPAMEAVGEIHRAKDN